MTLLIIRYSNLTPVPLYDILLIGQQVDHNNAILMKRR